MSRSAFDPVAFKAQQRAVWDAGAPTWEAWQDEIERWFAPINARLLALAGVRVGLSILDIGTGYGEPALSAARVVGPRGRVLGVDASPAMLALARKRAAGVANVQFVEGDLDALDQPTASFDAVLSRFGLMFAIDRVNMFRALARALVPGGVLAAAVWGPEALHLLSHGIAALSTRLELPMQPPGAPSPYSMSEAGQLTDELTAAGFSDVSVTQEIVRAHFRSVDEYVRFNRAALSEPMLRAAREHFGGDDSPEVRQALVEPITLQIEPDGSVLLPSLSLCVRAIAAR